MSAQKLEFTWMCRCRCVYGSLVLLVFMLNTRPVEGSGMLTHIDVGTRALGILETGEYKDIATRNQDAFQAGAPFPDWGYLCGQSTEAETAHWQPFIHEAVDYLLQTYQRPWNLRAQKLISFLLGLESHSQSDIVWHWGPNTSRADDQGFLHAMAHGASTCNDSWNGPPFPSCHTIGDNGADLLLSLRGDLDYLVPSWYLPTDDIVNIYKRLGQTVTGEQMSNCMLVFYGVIQAVRTGNGAGKAFPFYGNRSPFLQQNLNHWYSAGLDDMAVSVYWKLRAVIDLIESGTSTAPIPLVPLLSVSDIGFPPVDESELSQFFETFGLHTLKTNNGYILYYTSKTR